MTAGILAGLILATGTLLILLGLTPTNPNLAAAIDRLTPNTNPYDPRTQPPPPPADVKARLGAAAERTLAGRRGFTTPVSDLELIGRTSRWYWTEKASSALAGFLIPLILTLLNRLVGSPFPDALPAFMALIGATYFWFLPDSQVRAQARTARAAFGRAAVAYLQLMAIHRRVGAGAVPAMRDAATVSDTWMWVRIREEITRSTLAGVPAWDALTRLGDRTGIPELREVGDIMRLAGDYGAGVADNLLSRARGLRAEILGREHLAAINRTTAMNLPVIILVALTALATALPAIAGLLAA